MTITEYVMPNGRQTYKIKADEGKVLQRVADGQLSEGEMLLGYTWYIGGVKLEAPHWETPDDYIEVAAPEEDDEEDVEPIPDEDGGEDGGEDFVDSLELARERKLAALAEYDNSIKVNGFYVGEQLTWIDRDLRTTYKTSIEAAELLGEESITLPILGVIITIPIADAKIALAKVQRYADACAIVTQMHKAAIQSLEDEESVASYDFTAGYPDKLHFDLTKYLNT